MAMRGLFANVGSTMAGLMFVCAMFRQYFPEHLRFSVWRRYQKLVKFFNPQISITFNQFVGKWATPSQAYGDIRTYLGQTSFAQASRLIGSLAHNKTLVLGMSDFEEVADEFQGVQVRWLLGKHAPNTNSISVYSGTNHEKRYYTLTFHKRHRALIIGPYLNYVLKEGRALNSRNRKKKLYTNEDNEWNQVVFQHPATFETLALDPEKKKEIMDDLMAFSKGEQFYARIGRAWKRGYLLYGPPGTGKSTMIAAMANLLNYDVYDLELTGVKSNTELKKLLMEISSKSIIVIEDIDCSLDLTAPRKKAPTDKLADGEGDDKKDSVFTTNHVEKLDPALIRKGRMDKHIELAYCSFQAFKILAKNYLSLESHPAFPKIGELLGQVNMTPADVAEHLMPKTLSEEAEFRLEDLIKALEKAKEREKVGS
ncbi:AAA-ATPase [Vitis vinifera]|uniref:AAA-ATPase n=1 Tax=Vitis vinifera TaxID=29760 RepID=A0A438CL95_VITVI|nr:AAA-ATPase [Vitis vinifera]